MINVDNLVTAHDNPRAIRRHRRLLEELFYLCINETFIETVAEARIAVRGMMTDVGIDFPIQNVETATELRNTHLIGNEDYQSLLLNISEKHNYYHPSFTRNYWRVNGDVRDRLNILENIIFFNDPLPNINQNPIEHFNNRSGFMEIAVDESGPFIKMQFDIGTTKKEIQDIIDKQFPETARLQEEQYNIPDMQYRVDQNLRLKNAIHKLVIQGENDMNISLILEQREGLVDFEYTEDNVRMQKKRMNEATQRFNVND